MPIILESIWQSIDEASARGLDAVEILLSNWGEFPDAGGGAGNGYPLKGAPGLPTPAAVAIGPRSTVDRCYLCWDLAKTAVPRVDYFRRLSVGSPLNFFQPSRKRTISDGTALIASDNDESIFLAPIAPFAGELPKVAPSGTPNNMYSDNIGIQWNDTNGVSYTLADGSAQGSFGPNRWANDDRPKWLAPVLEVIWYLKPPLAVPPTQRAPLLVSLRRLSIYSAGDANNETLVAAIPTFGRKSIAVAVAPSVGAGNTCDLRVSAIPQVNSDPTTLNEANIGAVTNIADQATGRVVVSPLHADYVLVYLKPSTGVLGPGGIFNLYATATD